jgi:hypothetical protein
MFLTWQGVLGQEADIWWELAYIRLDDGQNDNRVLSF